MSTEEKMDLFRSVFLSSSEDENEDEAPARKEPTPPPPPKRPRYNNSPLFGKNVQSLNLKTVKCQKSV
jgi:hypothetical protein